MQFPATAEATAVITEASHPPIGPIAVGPPTGLALTEVRTAAVPHREVPAIPGLPHLPGVLPVTAVPEAAGLRGVRVTEAVRLPGVLPVTAVPEVVPGVREAVREVPLPHHVLREVAGHPAEDEGAIKPHYSYLKT